MQVTLAGEPAPDGSPAPWAAALVAPPAGSAVLFDGDAETGAALLKRADSAEPLDLHPSAAIVRWRGGILEYAVGDGLLVLLDDTTVFADAKGFVEHSGLIALLSPGIAAAVLDYQALTWIELLHSLTARGPGDVIGLIRELERNDPDRRVWPRPSVHRGAALIVLRP